MVVVSNVEKRFAGVAALRGVSFTARPGEVLGFLGPNGAGKTTTLRIITGFLAAGAGSVTVEGFDVAAEPRAARARIGYLPESVPLYPEMRVDEYLAYRAALKGVPSRARAARIEAATRDVGLGDVRSRVIGQLSRGYRQRVGLADALTHQPPVLILDEPTEGLDPNQRREVLDVVRALGRERTVVLSTHVLPEAETLCGRVVILDRGRIAASGTPAELALGASACRVRLEARGPEATLRAALARLDGVSDVEVAPLDGELRAYVLAAASDVREAAAAAVLAAGGALRALQLDGAGLDRVFAALARAHAAEAPAPPADSSDGEGDQDRRS